MGRWLFFLILMFPLLASASAGITYHGRLLRPDGTAVSAGTVSFRIQIRTPGAENCLLYEEQQVKDLSSSKGVFAITINDGTATVVNTEPFTLDRAFQNRGTFSFGVSKCVVGSSYVPNAADGRKLVVDFNDGSFAGWEQMPAQAINYVPMSIESMTVGGFSASSLVRVVDGTGTPTVVSPLTQAQHNTLLDLVNGTSALYRGAAATVPAAAVSGDIPGNSAGFNGSLGGDVTGSQAATLVTKIQGRAVDTAAPANGQALVWSAANSRWEPSTIATGASDWSTLTGKPATFPSDWATTANKPTSFPSDWTTTANIPATFAPSAHTHVVGDVTSGVGSYFSYKPNNGACAVGEVLKWSASNGGSWLCGTDISATGGSGVASVSATAPVTVDNTDPNNPRVEIGAASTSATGIVQLATSSDTAAGLAVQANDTRLANSRAPTGAAGGELAGNYPNPTVVASTTASNNSLVRRDGSGNIAGAAGTLSSLVLTNGTSTATFSVPLAFTTYATKFPSGTGGNGQVLTSNGTDMVWANPPAGDNLGNHAATANVKLGSYWLSGDGDNEGLRVDSSGNVGVGTSSALAKLHVANATDGDLIIESLSATGGNSGFSLLSKTGAGVTKYTNIVADWSGNLVFRGATGMYDFRNASNASSLYVGTDGNVGIGTGAPATTLEVNGSVKFGSTATCDASRAGTQRWNAGTVKMEVCNGSSWVELGGATSGSAILAFGNAYVPGGATRYYAIASGNSFISNSESEMAYPLPRTGTLKNFYVRLTTGQSGGALVLTVRKNGAATGITINVPSGSTSGTVLSDTIHSASIAAGDYITVSAANASGSSSATLNMVLEFSN